MGMGMGMEMRGLSRIQNPASRIQNPSPGCHPRLRFLRFLLLKILGFESDSDGNSEEEFSPKTDIEEPQFQFLNSGSSVVITTARIKVNPGCACIPGIKNARAA